MIEKKQTKQNDDEIPDDSNDKENIGSDANLASTIANLPIVIASDDENSQNEEHTKSPPSVSTNGSLPLLFSGNYFQIISRNVDGTKAKCMAPNCGRIRTGTKTTTSNFTTHLKVHR